MANSKPNYTSPPNKHQFDSEMEAVKVLEAEGRKLKYVAIKVWRQYLSSYKPKYYVDGTGKRTKDSLRSIKLGRVIKVDEDTIGIEVTYQNDLAYHESAFGGEYPQGHAIMLISQGWQVSQGWHQNIDRFGHYSGFNYLKKVREEYNKIKDKRISLDVQWLGNDDYTR